MGTWRCHLSDGTMSKSKLLLCLAICGALLVLLASVQYNWLLFARWNLVLSGNPFAKIANARDVRETNKSFPTGQSAASLAYDGTNYLGYLDNFGYFHGRNSDGLDLPQASSSIVTLRFSQASCLAVTILLLGALWCKARNRSGRTDP